MGLFRTYWWKILAILLVTYSVVMSFIVPLSPGITSVEPSRLKPGINRFIVYGYNSSFTHPETRLWLAAEQGKYLVPATITKVFADDRVLAEVLLPDKTPSSYFDLAISNPRDGTYMLGDAFFMQDAELQPGAISPGGASLPAIEENYFSFPFKSLLYESLRNLNFHVTMWFVLLFTMLVGVIKSIQYLAGNNLKYDRHALESVKTGLWFGILGIVTGSIWARFTWGAWWVNDTKLNGAAISILIYLAYLVLRNSLNEEQKRARISAVYNIFAFIMLVVFIQILPRMTDSLHPGNGGNPAFSQYDLDNNLRLVFYPAVAGWILTGAWMLEIRTKMSRLKAKYLAEHV